MPNQPEGGRKAPITPHKGGRTERAYIRLTPEDKAALVAIKAATGKTAADLLSEIIVQYVAANKANVADGASSVRLTED